MKLCFDSIEEVKAFVGELKGTRGGKKGQAEADEPTQQQAPTPLQPPGAQQFNPQQQMGQQFTPPAGGFPGATVAQISPEVDALVKRIVPKIDGAIASGQPMDTVLGWFRSELTKNGLDAAASTLDHVKTVHLPKLSVPALTHIAQMMNA